MAARGLSLHLGLNRVDPSHYGSEAPLRGCHNDARAMQGIAKAMGYSPTTLLDEAATSNAVLTFLRDASRQLKPGDALLVTYAGHGSQVQDTNSPAEPDGRDETWCLFDRMLVDDELARCWMAFAAGVRIVLVSDSCHSATVARALALLSRTFGGRAAIDDTPPLPLPGATLDGFEVTGYRVLPEDLQRHAESNHGPLYEAIQREGPGSETAPIRASVLSLTACQDDETAADGNAHGLFTQRLLEVWNEGKFAGTYRALHQAILARIAGQRPNYRVDGAAHSAFESSKAFTLSGDAGQNKKGEIMTITPGELTIDERLSILTSSRLGRSAGQAETSNGRCHMSLSFPDHLVRSLSDEQFYDFLLNEGCTTMMKAYLTVRSVSAPREVSGGISCAADSKGNAGCEARLEVRF